MFSVLDDNNTFEADCPGVLVSANVFLIFNFMQFFPFKQLLNTQNNIVMPEIQM